MDEQTAKILQSNLEKQISEWSLHRFHLHSRLKHMRIRMLIVGGLLIVLEAIRTFVPQLVFPPYNSIMTLALSIWFVTLVAKYSIGYKDKVCTRSADRIIKLAAEYNEAIKDVPNARRCDFLPPEIYHRKKNFTTKKRASATVFEPASTSAEVVAQTTGQAGFTVLPSEI